MDECDCTDCSESETPCHMDCESDSLCRSCAEVLEASKDREHDEACALGYRWKETI